MMENKFEIFENDENQNKDDFYQQFKEKLENVHTFPTNYVFKFIVPSEHSKIAQLHAIFNDVNANFSTKESKGGKYTSVTITLRVKEADEVIAYYKQAAKIKGTVML